jgi:kinesin family protein 11
MSGTEKKNYQLVKVYVRERPFSKNEIESKRPCIVKFSSSQELCIKSGSLEKQYTFDKVLGSKASQFEVYSVVVFPLIDCILSGYTCTVFAYGPTGTGKTYTMIGQNITPSTNFDNDPSIGIIPRAAAHLFSELKRLNKEFTVTISFIEIYNEEVRDLLIKDSVPLRVYDDPDNKGSTCIKGLCEVTVHNTNEVYNLLNMGTAERQTAATNLNRLSSRSHTIFTILVRTRELTIDGEEIIKSGKLNLIDLAGSENIGKSGATDMRAREAGTINKSLLTLGKVIKALASKMQHVPYRESKLTRILQDCLGGNCKTCLIATFSPCAFEETVSTLEYAHVARSIANCPQVNVSSNQSSLLENLQHELEALSKELNQARAGDGFHMNRAGYEKLCHDMRIKNERIVYLIKEITQLKEHMHAKQQQYEKLDQSFHRANADIEIINKELKEKNMKHEINQYVITHLNGTLQKLNNTTNLLLNVCETSKTHREIFYKKYETQINSTLHNASVAKKISSVSAGYLQQIQNSLETCMKNQEVSLLDLKSRISSLKDCQNLSLEHLHRLELELHSQSANQNLTFDNLFRTNAYSESTISSWLNSVVEENNQLQLQRHQEIKKKIENVGDYIFAKSAELEVQTAQGSVSLDDQFAVIENCSDVMSSHLLNLYRSLEEKYNNIQERRARNKTYRISLENSLTEATLKYESLLKERASIKNTQKIIDEIGVTLTSDMNKPLLNVKQTLISLNGCIEPMKVMTPMITDVIDNIEENRINSEKDIETCKCKMHQYFSTFINTFKEDLNYHNNVGSFLFPLCVYGKYMYIFSGIRNFNGPLDAANKLFRRKFTQNYSRTLSTDR